MNGVIESILVCIVSAAVARLYRGRGEFTKFGSLASEAFKYFQSSKASSPSKNLRYVYKTAVISKTSRKYRKQFQGNHGLSTIAKLHQPKAFTLLAYDLMTPCVQKS